MVWAIFAASILIRGAAGWVDVSKLLKRAQARTPIASLPLQSSLSVWCSSSTSC